MGDTSARSTRARAVARLGLILLLIAVVVVGWLYFTAPEDGGLRGTVWKHETAHGSITLEFSRIGYLVGNPVVQHTSSASGQGSMTYTVLDDKKTLLLASGEKLTIDSITSEELVLSGGPWRFDKTKLTRQK